MKRVVVDVELFRGEWILTAEVLVDTSRGGRSPEVVWGAVYSEAEGGKMVMEFAKFDDWADSVHPSMPTQREVVAELEGEAIEKACPYESRDDDGPEFDKYERIERNKP